MFSKYLTFLLQAILPPVIVFSIAHVINLPVSEWKWLEFLLAVPLALLALITIVLIVLISVFWFHNLVLSKRSENLHLD
jgi:hypothetical protein